MRFLFSLILRFAELSLPAARVGVEAGDGIVLGAGVKRLAVGAQRDRRDDVETRVRPARGGARDRRAGAVARGVAGLGLARDAVGADSATRANQAGAEPAQLLTAPAGKVRLWWKLRTAFDRYESRGPRKQDGRHVPLAALSCRRSGAEEALSDVVARVDQLHPQLL